MIWVVAREGVCYVEQVREDLQVNGEVTFETEREAVECAIMFEEDARAPISQNIRRLRSRLRRLATPSTGGAGQ